MNKFMTSRRLEALTHGWQDINKIFGRLNVLPCALPQGVGEENKQTRAHGGLSTQGRVEFMDGQPCFQDAKPKLGEKTGSHPV